jgi:hypothetical protein
MRCRCPTASLRASVSYVLILVGASHVKALFFFASAVQGAGGVCPVETDAPSQTTLPARPCDALVPFGGEALRY